MNDSQKVMTALPVMLPSDFLLSLSILICKFRDLVRGIILCFSAKPNILIWVGDIPKFFENAPSYGHMTPFGPPLPYYTYILKSSRKQLNFAHYPTPSSGTEVQDLPEGLWAHHWLSIGLPSFSGNQQVFASALGWETIWRLGNFEE